MSWDHRYLEERYSARTPSGTQKPVDRDSCGTPTGLKQHRQNQENYRDCPLCSWVSKSLAYRATPEGKAAFRDKGTNEWDKFIKNAPHGTADRMEWELWNRRIYDSRGNMKPEKVEGWLAGKPMGELCLECLERKTRPGYPERGRLTPEQRASVLEKAHQKLREKGKATRERKQQERDSTPKKPRGRKPPSQDVLQDEIARGLRHPNGVRKPRSEQQKVLDREEAQRQQQSLISQFNQGDYPGLCGTEAGLKKHKKDKTPVCEKCRTSAIFPNPLDPDAPLISHEVDVKPVLSKFYDAVRGFSEGTVSAEDYDRVRGSLSYAREQQRRKLYTYDPTKKQGRDFLEAKDKAWIKPEHQQEQDQATARYDTFSSHVNSLLDAFPESGEFQRLLDKGSTVTHPTLDVLGKYPVDNNYGIVAPSPTKSRGRKPIVYPDIDEETGLPQGMEMCGPERWHGTRNGYVNYGCRGDACRWAFNLATREYKQRSRNTQGGTVSSSKIDWNQRYAAEKDGPLPHL